MSGKGAKQRQRVDYRRAYLMFKDGASYREIAAALGITRDQAKNRVRLGERFKDEWGSGQIGGRTP